MKDSIKSSALFPVARGLDRFVSLLGEGSRSMRVLFWIGLWSCPVLASAQWSQADEKGKLLLTSGVSSIDGLAGGGLTPWAVTGSPADQGQWGGTAFATGLSTAHAFFQAQGLALSWSDRLEVSVSRQQLDTRHLLAPLNTDFDGLKLTMTVLAIKAKVWGDAVLDADRWTPQVAVGIEHKRLHAGAFESVLTQGLGASLSGTDVFVSATKLFLGSGILLNGTLRLTQANQNGLLGFGSADHRGHRLEPELSVAYLLTRQWVVGAEYRFKPDNLRNTFAPGALAEDDWKDLFVAWAPNKNLSVTAAIVDLGRIAPALQPRRQRGGYVSAQVAY